MSNTTTWKNNTIMITGLDADWSCLTDAGYSWLKVKYITFHPSAANDVFRINDDNSATGPDVMHVKCADATDDKIMYFGDGAWMQPYIDESDCTFGTAASAKVIIGLA